MIGPSLPRVQANAERPNLAQVFCVGLCDSSLGPVIDYTLLYYGLTFTTTAFAQVSNRD
jgi:hypothetical protein